MFVYHLWADKDRYQYLTSPWLDCSEVYMDLVLDGTALADCWWPIPVQLVRINEFNPKLEPADIMFLELCPVMTVRAVEALGSALTDHGELLPLDCREGEYWLYNPLRLIDALNKEYSAIKYFEGTNKILSVKRHVFCSERVANAMVFNVPELRRHPPFATQTFVDLVEAAGLKGARFVVPR